MGDTPTTPPPSGERRCIFCAIVARDAPASWVAERERAIAFLTRGPLRPGHTLVIPRAHAATLSEVAPDDWRAVSTLALEVAGMHAERLGATGATLFLASGRAGEQSVDHLHLHVVPRAEGDGLDLNSWWERKVGSPELSELERVARRLRSDAP